MPKPTVCHSVHGPEMPLTGNVAELDRSVATPPQRSTAPRLKRYLACRSTELSAHTRIQGK
jgi:hypothetical protein